MVNTDGSLNAPSTDATQSRPEVNSPVGPSMHFPDAKAVLGYFPTLLKSAESECVGVTTRVSTADFTAIVLAVTKTLGVVSPMGPLIHRLSPPAGILETVSSALSNMSSLTAKSCQQGNGLPAVRNQQASSPSARKPSGKRVDKKGKKSSGKSSNKDTPSKVLASSAAQTASGESRKDVSSSKTNKPKTLQEAVFKKALRSYRGKGIQAQLAKEWGIPNEDNLRTRIMALTDEDIASYQALEVPSLAMTGVFEENLKQSWNELWSASEWMTRTRRRFAAAQGVAAPPEHLKCEDKTFLTFNVPQAAKKVSKKTLGDSLTDLFTKDLVGVHGPRTGDPSAEFRDICRDTTRVYYTAAKSQPNPDALRLLCTFKRKDKGGGPPITVAKIKLTAAILREGQERFVAIQLNDDITPLFISVRLW